MKENQKGKAIGMGRGLLSGAPENMKVSKVAEPGILIQWVKENLLIWKSKVKWNCPLNKQKYH